MERKRHTNLLRGLAGTVAVLVAMALSPALASAGTVGGNQEDSGVPLSSNWLVLEDESAAVNDLTVTFDDKNTPASADDEVTFHDAVAPIEKLVGPDVYPPAQTQCFEDGPQVVRCQADNVTTVLLETGDGSDSIDVAGDPMVTWHESGPGADVIHGGPGHDGVFAHNGNDTVYGAGGDDEINGGADDDFIAGNAGDDGLEGQAGSDTVDGGSGPDWLSGGGGDDTVDYHLSASPLRIDLDGDDDDGTALEGDNVNANFETVLGGSAGDEILGSSLPETIRGNGGPDDLAGLGGNDVILGGTAADVLSGGSGRDDLRGEANDDLLIGGIDDDTLLGGTGADDHYGGLGSDTAEYWDRSAKVVADIGGEIGDDGEAGEGDTITIDTESIVGGSGPDELTGSDAANGIHGMDGDDVLTGGLGADTLSGGKGADSLRSNDGVADTDRCGTESDSVDADGADAVGTDCESVTRPAADVPATGGGADGAAPTGDEAPTAQGDGPAMLIARRAPIRRGSARVSVTCPATAAVACTGSLTLGPAGRTGMKSFTIASGERATLAVKVAKKVARKAARKGKAKVAASAIAQDESSASRTTTTRISLKAKRR